MTSRSRRKDTAGIITSTTRYFTADGTVLVQTNVRRAPITWTYHNAIVVEARKTYADGSHVDNAYNRLRVETLVHGITKIPNIVRNHTRKLNKFNSRSKNELRCISVRVRAEQE